MNSSELYHSIEFRIIGTLLYIPLSIIGIIGNIMVIVVVLRIKWMKSATNCYLVSLAVADCLLFLSAMPSELAVYHLPDNQYLFGLVGCKILSFLPYLSINASSLSITAFTVERYIGICHPMRAKYICTIRRAKMIIAGLWIFSLVYNAPWLHLTAIKPLNITDIPSAVRCTFKLQREQYTIIYLADFCFFYFIPLMLYLALYGRIAVMLMHSVNLHHTVAHRAPSRSYSNLGQSHHFQDRNGYLRSNEALPLTATAAPLNRFSHLSATNATTATSNSGLTTTDNTPPAAKSRIQVVKMLSVIVIIFALCWLPYRAVVVYNSFTKPPWVNKWFFLFAKTMIFVNSAANPVLYNIMSIKFRRAFKMLLLDFLDCGSNNPKLFYSTTIVGGASPTRTERPFTSEGLGAKNISSFKNRNRNLRNSPQFRRTPSPSNFEIA